jgi:hypothetical protein
VPGIALPTEVSFLSNRTSGLLQTTSSLGDLSITRAYGQNAISSRSPLTRNGSRIYTSQVVRMELEI